MFRSAKYILLFLIFCMPLLAWAQPSKIKFKDRIGDSTTIVNTAYQAPKIKGPKPLSSEISFGIRAKSDGYGIFVDKGWHRGGDEFGSYFKDKLYHVRLLQLEIEEHKHPKEYRSRNNVNYASSYILGKANNFYTVKLGYGRRQLLAGKPDPGTISLHWVYVGGIACGIVKPYYLYINNEETKYTENEKREFVNPLNINGAVGFLKGWNFDDLKFVPGFHAKTGLHLDFATKKRNKLAFEIGANGEYYTSKVLQMAYNDPKALFYNFYASIQFGFIR
jgi:hypothetical protein